MEGNASSLYGRVNRTSTRGFLAAGGACAAVLACFVVSAADPSLDDTGDVRFGLSSRSPRVWPVSRLLAPSCAAAPPPKFWSELTDLVLDFP
jgi:hypothetical protein